MAGSVSQPREERRVVTVVFTDLVGFTERSEELDPEDVRSLLTTYYTAARAIHEEHGGTVDKFIGDAVLAVFGAPVAHEDDPERAVRAALAICEWASGRDDIALRAGVNTGTAFVALEPSSTGMGIVAGDMINTASRIQSAAPTGGVLVGEDTYRATRDVFEYAERDAIEAKGKSEPVRVWHPLSTRVGIGGRSRRRGDAPLVGRDPELALLRDALERAACGEGAQLVTLVGVPGIGKTRLVAELERAARESRPDVTWLEGRSLPYGAGTSFHGLAEMIRAHAGIMETDGAAEAEAKLEHALTSLTESPSDSRWLSSQLRPLIGLAGESGPREDRRADAFAAWRRFFELLAACGPLVLVFDDLHWADDAVLDFLDELAQSLESTPLFVVGTARPELLERRPAWGEPSDNRTTARLEPLSADETSALLHALADDLEIGEDVEAALLERAGGNPLYAEEFVRMASEGGQGPGSALPLTVQGIVAARLDALSREEKDLLQDATVVGQVFWPGALRRVSEGSSRLDDLLADLERKEFVRGSPESTVAGEAQIAFRHPLIREVAYEQMPRARRAAKHRLAAEWVESLPAGRAEGRADMLADHYVRALEYSTAVGDDVGDLRVRAARALRDSGDQARALHSLDVAAARYRQALDLAHGDEERGATGLALAETELRTGAVEEAYAQLHEVIAIARATGDRELLARAALARGGVGVSVFDPDDAVVAVLEEALDALGPGHPALRARLLARLAIEVYYVSISRREQLGEEAVALARQVDEPEALLDALNARRVTLWSPDRLDERLDVSRELVERAEASGDRERSLLSRTWLVLDLVEGGDLDAARAEIDAYARLVEPLGIPAYSWWVPAWQAMLAGVEGRFDDVRALAEESREIGERAGDGNAAIYHGLACWVADMEQGRDLERWLPSLEEGVARGGPSDAFQCGLAMLLTLAGRLDDAREALAELGPEGFGAVVKDMNFYAGAGEFTIAVGILGDRKWAAEAYETLRPYAGRMFTIARAAVCWGPGDSFLGRLAATAGMWDQAERHFEDALAACERVGAAAMATRTRAWHAEMLRARARPGDDERAADLEQQAGAEAERMGLAL